MCMLWPLCLQLAYASGTDSCIDHACIWNLCVHWACASGTYNWVHWAYASGSYACTEHAHQELVSTLSIRIRYLCVHWACASGTYDYTEHTHQELMSALNKRIGYLCVQTSWAEGLTSVAKIIFNLLRMACSSVCLSTLTNKVHLTTLLTPSKVRQKTQATVLVPNLAD